MRSYAALFLAALASAQQEMSHGRQLPADESTFDGTDADFFDNTSFFDDENTFDENGDFFDGPDDPCDFYRKRIESSVDFCNAGFEREEARGISKAGRVVQKYLSR